MGYSKAPEQPQSSARPICHSHTMTRTGREPATVRIAASTHCATGDYEMKCLFESSMYMSSLHNTTRFYLRVTLLLYKTADF